MSAMPGGTLIRERMKRDAARTGSSRGAQMMAAASTVAAGKGFVGGIDASLCRRRKHMLISTML
jgi:hypothetical protein